MTFESTEYWCEYFIFPFTNLQVYTKGTFLCDNDKHTDVTGPAIQPKKGQKSPPTMSKVVCQLLTVVLVVYVS